MDSSERLEQLELLVVLLSQVAGAFGSDKVAGALDVARDLISIGADAAERMRDLVEELQDMVEDGSNPTDAHWDAMLDRQRDALSRIAGVTIE